MKHPDLAVIWVFGKHVGEIGQEDLLAVLQTLQ